MFSQPFTCGWILFSLTPPPHWVTPTLPPVPFHMSPIKAPPKHTDDFSGTSIYSVYYTRKYSNHSPSAAWGGLPCGFQWSQGQKPICLTYTSSTVYQIWFFGWIWPSHFIVYKSPQKWSQGQNPNCSTYTVSIMCLTPTMLFTPHVGILLNLQKILLGDFFPHQILVSQWEIYTCVFAFV